MINRTLYSSLFVCLLSSCHFIGYYNKFNSKERAKIRSIESYYLKDSMNISSEGTVLKVVNNRDELAVRETIYTNNKKDSIISDKSISYGKNHKTVKFYDNNKVVGVRREISDLMRRKSFILTLNNNNWDTLFVDSLNAEGEWIYSGVKNKPGCYSRYRLEQEDNIIEMGRFERNYCPGSVELDSLVLIPIVNEHFDINDCVIRRREFRNNGDDIDYYYSRDSLCNKLSVFRRTDNGVKVVYNFQYEYDDNMNWVSKLATTKSGDTVLFEKRIITYW